MNLIDLRTEVLDRGFSYMGDDSMGEARVNRWVNLAYQEICNMDDWPFLRASISTQIPKTITDLASVQFVQGEKDGVINPADERDLRDAYDDLSKTGPALFYYFTTPSVFSPSDTTLPASVVLPQELFPAYMPVLLTYPITTDTLTIVYTRFPQNLSADSDEPIIPQRFRYAIVEYACARAYLDNDNPAAAQVCRQEGDRIVFQMRDHLTPQQHQRSGFITRYGSDDG